MRVQNTILSGLTYVGISEVIARTVNLLTFALCTRYLGPIGFGIYSTAWALYSMALPIVQGGPELLGVRLLASDTSNKAITSEITALKIAFAVLAIVSLPLLAFIVYPDRSSIIFQTSVQSAVLFGVAIIPAWIARGWQRFDIHAGNRIIQAIVMTLAAFILLNFSATPLVIAFAELFSFLVCFSITARIMAANAGSTSAQPTLFSSGLLPLSKQEITDGFRKYSLPATALGISGLASAVETTVCIPISGYFLSSAEAGITGVTLRLVIFILAQFQVLLQIFYPRLSNWYATDKIKASKLAADLFVYFLILSTIAMIFVIVFATSIVHIVLGSAYLDAIPLLLVLSPILVAVGAGSVFGYVLLASGKQPEFTASNIAGAVSLIAGAWIAYGMEPSAIATGIMVPIFFVQVGIQGLFCYRYGLIDRRLFSLYRFKLAYFLDFLKS